MCGYHGSNRIGLICAYPLIKKNVRGVEILARWLQLQHSHFCISFDTDFFFKLNE